MSISYNDDQYTMVNYTEYVFMCVLIFIYEIITLDYNAKNYKCKKNMKSRNNNFVKF